MLKVPPPTGIWRWFTELKGPPPYGGYNVPERLFWDPFLLNDFYEPLFNVDDYIPVLFFFNVKSFFKILKDPAVLG